MTDLDAYQPAAIEQYQAALAMTPEQAKALDAQVRRCTEAVLREGTDYGIIPGTGGQKSLWRPGAQKLMQWFGLSFSCERVEIERDESGRKHGITYRAIVARRLPDGSLHVLATCEGTADYDESKFCQPAEEVQRKAEYNERKWARQYGRVADPTKWQNRGEYRADWNALMKRAQKRAIVGAVVDATAAGGIFADREDDEPAAPSADDGTQAWYPQALEAALTFTTTEDGQQLLIEAASAKRDGLCTPRQGDHVQNRARQRLQTLRTATPVDVEDLGHTDASPAAAAPGLQHAAQEPPTAPPAAGEVRPNSRKQKLIGVCHQQFQRLLGVDSEEETADQRTERLWMAAKLAGTDEIRSLADLDTGELSIVANALAVCKDRKRLEEILAAAGAS